MKKLQLPSTFSPATWKQLLEQQDVQTLKRGQDIVMGQNRIFLTDTAGATWVITVSTSGVLSAVAATPIRST